jgi:type IV pilus assembly protein PilV
MKTTKAASRRRYQAGFSLVEVLIALVIMSVGMLGIAGLYVQSLQAGRTSMFRHNAVTLAGDVADRIRANPTAGVAYNHAANATGTDNNCVTGGVICNPANMADNDIFLWQAQADDTLPNGAVDIVFNAGVNPPTYQITISWDEPGEQPTYIINISVLPI